MGETPQCVACGRTGGNLTSGIAINKFGCTGACLVWAIRFIDHQLIGCEFGGWSELELDDENCITVQKIYCDLNVWGRAVLCGLEYMVDWISDLYTRYTRYCWG